MGQAKRILITAGPTHEAIDGVRYIANRSSGRMGIALAEAARDAGHEVTLLLGPVARHLPKEMNIQRFENTADVEALLAEEFPKADLLIMAAAIADYRPKDVSLDHKLERVNEKLRIELEPTPDLVAACAQKKSPDQKIICFALEEVVYLQQRAKAKLKKKSVDAIVANPLQTMDSAHVQATIYTADGQTAQPEGGKISKDQFAGWLMNWISATFLD